MAAILLYGWTLLLWHLSVFWCMLPDYAYGWAVPVLTLLLFWRRRHALGPSTGFIDAPSLFLVVFLTLFFLPLRLVLDANLDWRLAVWLLAALVVSQTLVVIRMTGGRQWFHLLAFPVLFTLTGVPWLGRLEIPVTTGLMHFGAFVSTEVLNAYGVAADQRGNVIETAAGFIGVDEACSGIKSLQTMTMIGFFLSDFTAWSGGRRILIVLFGAGFATVTNLLRILVLAFVGSQAGSAGVDRWHDATGTVAFAAACIGLLIVVRTLPAAPLKASSSGIPASRRMIPAWLVGLAGCALVWLACTEAAPRYWYRPARPVGSPAWTVTWPDNLEAKPVPISRSVREQLQCDEGDATAWSIEPGTRWLGYYFAWKPGLHAYFARSQHSPDICLPATGRRLSADLGYFECPTAAKTFRVRHLVFDDETGPLNVFFLVDGSAIQDLERQLNADAWRVRLSNVRAHIKDADRRSLELIAAGYSSPADAAVAAKHWIGDLVRPAGTRLSEKALTSE